MIRMTLVLFILLLPSLCLGQENKLVSETVTRKSAAEISPGKFNDYQEYVILWDLKYKSFGAVHTLETEKQKFFQRDTTYLLAPWQGKELLWVGLGVPISLRCYKDQLYLIVFDRDSDFSKIRFRFFRQDHSVFAEIPAKDYPKEVAVQNLWLKKENGFRGGKPINEIEVAKNLDPESIDFQGSLTAKVWVQLETGKEYYEMDNGSTGAQFLKEFMTKHKVDRLQKIVKE